MMRLRELLMVSTALATLAAPAFAQETAVPPPLPPLPMPGGAASAPPLPPAPAASPAVPPLPEVSLPDTPPAPPAGNAASVPALPPLQPTPSIAPVANEAAPKLPELKTIGEIPPAREISSASKKEDQDWMSKIKGMVFGEEKKPAPEKAEVVKAAPPPLPPVQGDAPAGQASAPPPLPPLKTDDLKEPGKMDMSTPPLPPLGAPPAPAPELAIPKAPDAAPETAVKDAPPSVPPLPDISAPPPVAPLAMPDMPTTPESKEPEKKDSEELVLPKLPDEPKTADAPSLPPFPDMSQEPVIEPMPAPPAPMAEQETPTADEPELSLEDQQPNAADPDVFEFGNLNQDGKRRPARVSSSSPQPRDELALPQGDLKPDMAPDMGTLKFKDHNYRTQVLPSIINRKEYETRNAHLPKAMFKEDLEGLLFQSIAQGDLNAVRSLLDRGVNVEAKNAIGDTPLVHASINGQAGAVRVLLSRGANPNNPNVHGVTAIQVAAERGREDIIEALFEMGAKSSADYRNPLTPLKSGVGRGYASVYNAMLDGENPRLAEQEKRNRALSALASAGPAPRLVISAGVGGSNEIRDPRLQKAPGEPLSFDEIEKGLMYKEYVRKVGEDPAAQSMAYGSVPKIISPGGAKATPTPIPYPAKPPMMAVPQAPREGMQLPPQPYGAMVPMPPAGGAAPQMPPAMGMQPPMPPMRAEPAPMPYNAMPPQPSSMPPAPMPYGSMPPLPASPPNPDMPVQGGIRPMDTVPPMASAPGTAVPDFTEAAESDGNSEGGFGF